MKLCDRDLRPLSKLRIRRFSGLFWPIFDSFCGGSIRNLIQSPQKESKIGSKEPENRQNLSFERGLMQVIYVDNHLLVAVKPAGLSTQPHDGESDNFLDRAKAWIKVKYNKPGKVFLEPIHRLDKPVSGLVLFARTSKALSRLQRMMREREISKTYIALVEGKPPSQQGELVHYLIHDDHRATISYAKHPDAKCARLRYEVVGSKGPATLVKIVLETGRYHQIRAQWSAIGCPVVGDRKYGSKQPWNKEGIALHHAMMSCKHPTTLELLNLASPFESGIC